MNTVTIQAIIKTLKLALNADRKWARECKADPTVAAQAERFAAVVKAVETGDWSQYKPDLLNWVKTMELGASHGYSRVEIRNMESMKRYNEFRRVLGLPVRKSGTVN